MQVELPTQGLEKYKSASQRARVATEAWGADYLFCANCDSPRLQRAPANTPAVDFLCPRCSNPFQLKGQSRPFSGRITDAAYDSMMRFIRQNQAPNLLVLHYEAETWSVRNLILVPRFVFTESAIEKRKPLGPTARRAGWVGCNIVLANIPENARIPVVAEGIPNSPDRVRENYQRLRPLQKMTIEKRGWMLDVLNSVHALGKPEFSLSDAYSAEKELQRLHPRNRHVREKIRQQLQVLRDLGLLEFLGPGRYRLL